MLSRFIFALLCVVLFSGCASKFKRDAIETELAAGRPNYDDKQIKAAFEKKPNLPKHFKIAVYFKEHSGSRFNSDWRWNATDKSFLEPLMNQLIKQGIISEVFPVLSSLVTNSDLKSLRMVAARQNADALLVIDGVAQFDKYVNAWGATYLLLLPALFVPGSDVDTLFVTSATLWDVKNEYLYFATEAEAQTHHEYIAAFGNREAELIEEAKSKALENLRVQVTDAVKGKSL